MATQPETMIDQPSRGAVVPMSPQREGYAIMKDKARLFAQSPLIPEHLRGRNPDEGMANCLIAIQMAEAMGEMPLVVMQNIHVVKGKAGFAAQYMIARANASGVFKGRIGWDIDRSDAKNLKVTAYAHLADTGERVEFTVEMAMAQAEGWTSNSKYRTMPEVMLRYRAATFLVRFYAPDVMLGYQTSEEVEDVLAASAPPPSTPLSAGMLIEQASASPDDTANAQAQITPTTEDAEVVEEQPAWAAKHDEFVRRLDAATTPAEVTEIDSEMVNHLVAFPDDVQQHLTTTVAMAMRRVRKAATEA